ncbi:TlpA family protein disulfide reductase [Shewanella sedimentimangrovi]|uniref:Thioredoxin domain-containing protein n=1 Tax=Shewanella sedimentimangrovi TaxID=2814293 RepID=A0ABX7R1K8_9GAMM|nr:hypothetical protein [Shewanella sedimentimangrovi]QSX37694.1 hypothetical protein JYB85_02305 [Shewanella sedimentimangrovi]
MIRRGLMLGLWLFAGSLTAAPLLTAQSLDARAALMAGQRWVSICWSLDCPACIRELGELKLLLPQINGEQLLLINTDADADREQEQEQLLAQLGLTALPQLSFADGQEQQGRFLLDPSWYGELPRTFFIDESGNWKGKSGLVEREWLRQWLAQDEASKQTAQQAPLIHQQ